MKYAAITLLIFLVIDGYYSVKYGYNKKPKFWQVFQNASLFFVPILMVCGGVSFVMSGYRVAGVLLAGFGILIGAGLLVVGLKK